MNNSKIIIKGSTSLLPFLLFILLGILLNIYSAHACTISDTIITRQESTAENNRPNLFNSDSLLEITIVTDIRKLIRDVGKKRQYHPATLTYQTKDSSVTLDVNLKTRGDFRKDRSICSFPPLRIKFQKKQVSNTLFNHQEKLKMVTHCQNRSKRHQQMLIQEYLIYKAYNLFTPESFRVRLARITYMNNDLSKKIIKYAFFLEDPDQMAQRNNKIIVRRNKLHQDATAMDKITRLAVFQYLIGNTDWGVPTLHNIKLIAIKPSARPVAVPYDFDWSALVDAPYAVPQEILHISSIHERLYRGYERSLKDLEFIFREFRQKKIDLYSLYVNCPYLEDYQKESVLNYFDQFYETINDPKKVKREFIEKSRKYKYKKH